MSSVVIAGDTSGSVTLQAPAVAGSTTLNLPTTSGTVVVNSSGVAGMTSLGTITLSGTGNQFSLGSLTLTSYKALYVSLNAVSSGASGSNKLSFTNTTGDQTAVTNAFTILTSTSTNNGLVFGGFFVDLVSGLSISNSVYGTPTAISAPVPLGTGTPAGAGTLGITGYQTAIGTASTTIYVYIAGAGTKSGTITIYGVA